MHRTLLILISILPLAACSNPALESSPSHQTIQNHTYNTEQTLLNLSKDKWKWMSEKNVSELNKLFDAKSKFVHMSGTWNQPRELEIIESGSIWYKNADVHASEVEIFNDTAIVWSRITLEAVVRGNTVSNEFTVTEVYQNSSEKWKLINLTFSKVRDSHTITQQ